MSESDVHPAEGRRISVFVCDVHGAIDAVAIVRSSDGCPVMAQAGLCGRQLHGPKDAIIQAGTDGG